MPLRARYVGDDDANEDSEEDDQDQARQKTSHERLDGGHVEDGLWTVSRQVSADRVIRAK